MGGAYGSLRLCPVRVAHANSDRAGETGQVSLVVVVLLCVCVVGVATGGSLARLGELRLRSSRIAVAALVVQVSGTVVGGPVHTAGLVVSSGLAVAFLFRNRELTGAGLVAAGLLLNVVVIVANGAMPVSLSAAARAGAPVEDLLAGTDPRHELAGAQTRLALLGDVVPVRLPLRPEVVSAGDVLVAAGIGQLVALVVTGRGAGGPRPAGRASRRQDLGPLQT
jgi:hypothetical protein